MVKIKERMYILTMSSRLFNIISIIRRCIQRHCVVFFRDASVEWSWNLNCELSTGYSHSIVAQTLQFQWKFPRWWTLNRTLTEGYSETYLRKCTFNILKITSCVLILFGLTFSCIFPIKMPSTENRCNMIEKKKKKTFSIPEAYQNTT